MELFEAIAKRHSYRGAFKDIPVSRDDLKKIVEAGMKAPSGKNAQTTSFVIIDDKDILEKIGGMHVSNKAMQQCKAMIVCIINNVPEPVYEGFSFEVEDCAAAVENMLLAITALGLASVWIDGWLRRESRAEKIGDLLSLPKGKIVRIILPIGIPAEEHSQPEKLPFCKRAWFNKFGE
ncbi:MAG: nitroreductase family protein [Sedimentisphaerales bacterium]|nr:nitroreductase family protein [Sedimentisphaerales bacterium]